MASDFPHRRLAYADPPYPGQAKKHYNSEEVDHAALILKLMINYDGWALSTSSTALTDVLRLCPSGVRIMAWVKPFAAFKRNVSPAYAWEPVIVVPARKPAMRVVARDWHSESITMKKGLSGAKPPAFCAWLFDMLGARQGDSFDDLFPGTNGVTEAWRKWQSAPITGKVELTEIEPCPQISHIED